MTVSLLQCDGVHYVLTVFTYRHHPTGYQLSETEYLNFVLFNQTALTFIKIVIITLHSHITFLVNGVRIFQSTFRTLRLYIQAYSVGF